MRSFIRAVLWAWCLAASAAVCGCIEGPGHGCQLTNQLTVSPSTATADHTAKPPANQVQFLGIVRPTGPPGCAIPEWIAKIPGQWSNPDPADIQISSASDQTNGTAVCLAATDGPVTLTGVFSQLLPQPETKTVQLTCQ